MYDNFAKKIAKIIREKRIGYERFSLSPSSAHLVTKLCTPRHQAPLGDALAVKLCFAFHQLAKQSFANTAVPKPELGYEE